MLTLKVIYPEQGFKNYNVYSARQYGVYELSDGTTQLLLTVDAPEPIDIRLCEGTQVYVMNESGSTIDSIYLPHQKVVSQKVTNKLWDGVPQRELSDKL